MNCQDVSVALDDRGIGALSETERREIDTHLVTCADCARDWEVETRLAAICVPAMPLDLPGQIRRSLVARRGFAGNRANRLVLIGAVLAIAAAAAMFASHPSDVKPRASAATTQQIDRATVPPLSQPAEPAAGTASPAENRATVTLASRTKVLIKPLQMQSENPEVQATLREFYDRFVAGMRAIPGLVVLTEEADDVSEVDGDFRLTLSGGRGQIGLAPRGNWSMSIRLDDLRKQRERLVAKASSSGSDAGKAADSVAPASFSLMITGGLLPSACSVADRRSDCRPAGVLAAMMVEPLRLDILPGDPELRRDLRARVLDATQSFATRFDALELLARKAPRDVDSDVIHAALDLIVKSPGAYGRQRLLSLLHGYTQPELLRALIDMANQDPDVSVRMEALSMLIEDFKSDPAARREVESLAAADLLPLVRHVAERAISGDGGWNEYVVATVQDTHLSPAQRFAPLLYLYQSERKSELRGLLDDRVVAALVDVLPALVDKDDPTLAAIGMLALLPSGDSPAVIDLVLASFDGASKPAIRLLLTDLLSKYRDNPRVHGRLVEIASGEPDTELGRKAATILATGQQASLQSPTR